MSDPLDDLKTRLDLAAVIGAEHKLRPAGAGKLAGVEHDSLHVDLARQVWSWKSQPAPAGRRFLGGDALAWIAYRRFGRTHVDGADFTEVLRIACSAVGEDYDRLFARDAAGARAAEARRRREETLGAYADLARKTMTAEAAGRIRKLKPWLTHEIMDRWGLGLAPTSGALKGAKLAFADLVDVGLVRWRKGISEEARKARTWEALGSARDAYPFFRERIIIPFYERGRCVYLGGRDIAPKALWEKTEDRRQKTEGASESRGSGDTTGPRPVRKMLYLPRPWKDPETGEWGGGVPAPDGFGLDAIYAPEARERGIMLVEGALDAIACCERGYPAIGMMGVNASEGLLARLRRAG